MNSVLKRAAVQCIALSSDSMGLCDSLILGGIAPAANGVVPEAGGFSDAGENPEWEWQAIQPATLEPFYLAVLAAVTTEFVGCNPRSSAPSRGDTPSSYSSSPSALPPPPTRGIAAARRAGELWNKCVFLTKTFQKPQVLLAVLRSAKQVTAALYRWRGAFLGRMEHLLGDALPLLRSMQASLRQVHAVLRDAAKRSDVRRLALLPAVKAGTEKVL